MPVVTRSLVLASVVLLSLASPACLCGGDPWSVIAEDVPEALLSVSGTTASDVWIVGNDVGSGPAVLHFDGTSWERRTTGTRGALWWVHATAPDRAWFGGEYGTVLRWDGTTFERQATPGVAAHTVFGVWAGGDDDVWAVGSVSGRNGFIWHFDGTAWRDVPAPLSVLPVHELNDAAGFFKVWGDGAGTVWVVGGMGTLLRSDGGAPFEKIGIPTDGALFTIAGYGDDVALVGGPATGGPQASGGQSTVMSLRAGYWENETPMAAPLLQGVSVSPTGRAVATGQLGDVWERRGRSWEPVYTGLETNAESLHAVWIDPDEGVWTVGGNVLSTSLDQGVAWYSGKTPPPGFEGNSPDAGTPPPPTCPENKVDPVPDGSIARRWNEQMLDAIRRDIPRPGVHARNLFHVSVAMWDAWATYDTSASGYVTTAKATSEDVEAARTEAISRAAHKVLKHRYSKAIGGAVSVACFDALLTKLGYTADDVVTGDDAHALGNRIGQAVIDAFDDDGANEIANYSDTTGYTPVNEALIVERPGAVCVEPSKWQELNLAVSETQNGLVLESGVQQYIGSNWGGVTPFSLVRSAAGVPYYSVGDVPRIDHPEMKRWVLDVIRKTAVLDPADPATLDISPGAYGHNPLGSNGGTGHTTNPVTAAPYAANVVLRGDFARVLAEFWADGPSSETPPGHWNKLANEAFDHPAFERKLFGQGEPLDRLSWDVHAYFTLNAAVHDAAIAAWELKRVHRTARPITLVRYMGGKGQSSDPSKPAYDPLGLPLEPGLVELVTEQSSAPGQRHAHLARFVGQVALRGWRGEPGDRKREVGGVAWMRAVDWMPYQRRTFVTPAFPGYVSGHSTFSRAAARVLATLTGSDFFPGGLAEFKANANAYLFFERGPSTDVTLQWATYYDAADQAGQSRIYGSIHIEPDDFDGRRIGDDVGQRVLAKVVDWFGD